MGDADVKGGPQAGLIVAREGVTSVGRLELGSGQEARMDYRLRNRSQGSPKVYLHLLVIIIHIRSLVESSLVLTQRACVFDHQNVLIVSGQFLGGSDHQEIGLCVDCGLSNIHGGVRNASLVQFDGVQFKFQGMQSDRASVLGYSNADLNLSGERKVLQIDTGVQMELVAQGMGLIG